MKKSFHVIANPLSGGGRAVHVAREVAADLGDAGGAVRTTFSPGIEAADARVTAARNQAAAKIANARASLAAAEARLTAIEQSGLAESREALRLAELSYRAGKASLLELLDAQQAYALTQSDLIAARQARVEAAASLVREAAAQ